MREPRQEPDESEPADLTLHQRLAVLQSAIRSLEIISRSVYSSASWRTGQRVARLLRWFGIRLPVSTAESETERLIGELKNIAKMPDLDRAPKPDDVVLGNEFLVSESRPRRFPASPPPRPVSWMLATGTTRMLETELGSWKFRPVFSVVVPVHNTKAEWLEQLIESIRAQFYPQWQLVLVDDASTRDETLNVLASVETDPKIRILRQSSGGGISVATNAGIAVAEGDYVAFVDHDDLLEPDALLQVGRAIEQTGADMVYSDEDKIDEAGEEKYDPHYKPAWSPDLLLSQNYVSHLTAIRRALIVQVGGLNSEFDGSQDHDLLLRCAEKANEIVHVPMVLYHWRAVEGSTAREFGEKTYPWDAGRRAVEQALKRRGIAGVAGKSDRPGTYRVTRDVSGSPVVSILIPFRDQPKLLEQCVRSILEKTEYAHYEIIGIDNQSSQPATLALMRKLVEKDPRVRFEVFDQAFNFSAINNFGATVAKGEHLLLMNNDTEAITPDWLGAMLGHSQREGIGAVGAKLLYPDDRIQHAGAILGIGGVAGHAHKFISNTENGYFSRPHITQNVSAVTGACLMIKKKLYQEINGLEEHFLSIAFNDIDFCIRLREKGLLNIYEPAAVLYHHESISRGYEDTDEKKQRFSSEVRYMQFRHAEMLAECDPYFSPNFSPHSEKFIPR